MDRGTEGIDPARRRREDPVETGARHRLGAEQDAAARNGGSLRWGTIWAGALAALLLFLILDLLVFGIGITSATDRPGDTGSEDWVSGIVGVIAFFVGGYVATGPFLAALRESRAALIEGLLVWALGSLLLIALSVLGIGQFFGALGDVIGQAHALGDPSTTIEPSQLTNTIKSSALGAFLSLVVWAIASAVGSSLGSRR